MAVFVCPHCHRDTRLYNGKIQAHTVLDPVKTWINRPGEATGMLIDIYPRCEWSDARFVFPDKKGTP